MFQKAHFLFTLLCSGTTIAIIILISLLYLHVSENSLSENQFRSFQNDAGTIVASLEDASSISIQWLERMEAQNDYIIYVIDNGTPFLYNTLRVKNDSTSQSLLAEALNAYQKMFPVDAYDAPAEDIVTFFNYDETDLPVDAYDTLAEEDGDRLYYNVTYDNSAGDILVAYEDIVMTITTSYAYYGIRHNEYQFRSPSTGNSYYASLIDIEGNPARTQMILLYSLKPLYAQIFQQRIRFLLIDLAAALILLTFSFFFTGRILKPIRANQEAQMQFFAAASHELRTPLSVMLASAECCEEASVEEQKSFFQTIRKEGHRMNSLLGDMLTLAHSGTNRFPIEQAPAQLDTLCLNAYEAFESLCRNQGLRLSLTLPDDVPPRCLCDAERITQVLSILLHNAVSYTPEGGKIALSLEYREDASHLPRRMTALRYSNNRCFVITVADTGIGISDADKKHIFERFYRAEKSRSAKEHFGLGLSIAYEIVQAHNGRISVEDNPGGGSLFVVSLPG